MSAAPGEVAGLFCNPSGLTGVRVVTRRSGSGTERLLEIGLQQNSGSPSGQEVTAGCAKDG